MLRKLSTKTGQDQFRMESASSGRNEKPDNRLIRYEGTKMPLNNRYEDHNADLSLSFLCAAGSAILLSFARVFGELWFISLFALVPFLWRLCHVSLRGAVSLGMMLATFFVFATSVSELILAPKIFLLKLLSLNIAFALFALVIHRARKHLGFDPLFIALLWFPMEYVLIHYANLGTIFSISNSGSTLIIGFYSLFGILLGSLAVVLGNSLLLLILKYVAQRLTSSNELLTTSKKRSYTHFFEVILEQCWYCFPNVRAPPPACN